MQVYLVNQIEEFKSNGQVIERVVFSHKEQVMTLEIPPPLTGRFSKGDQVKCQFVAHQSDSQPNDCKADFCFLGTVVPTWTNENIWTLSVGGLVVQVTPRPPVESKSPSGSKFWIFLYT